MLAWISCLTHYILNTLQVCDDNSNNIRFSLPKLEGRQPGRAQSGRTGPLGHAALQLRSAERKSVHAEVVQAQQRVLQVHPEGPAPVQAVSRRGRIREDGGVQRDGRPPGRRVLGQQGGIQLRGVRGGVVRDEFEVGSHGGNFIRHGKFLLFCFAVYTVLVNGMFSDRASVTSCVPQGSVLGPLLYSIYTSDIIYPCYTKQNLIKL